MKLTKEIEAAIKRLNSVSSIQYIENIKSVEELENLLPTLFAEADAITIAVQALEAAILNTKHI